MLPHLREIIFVSSAFLFTTLQADSADCYVAAVVEYNAPRNPTVRAAENILNNVNNYLKFIHNASLIKADIIVFPELGLIGHGNRVHYSEVPSTDDDVIPCTHNGSSEVIAQLSCAARSYSMYVVVNLPEVFHNSSGYSHYYNTDVVFDRTGKIVARYRKYNLFGEPENNIPELEYVYFDTDFGVRFGVFICFDIDFKDPAVSLVKEYNVRHFVFSAAWISELPFLTAIQAQWSWAYSLDVVLLASGLNDPENGSSGTGIYQGRKGPLTYMMTNSAESSMLWANVSKSNYTFSMPSHVKPIGTPKGVKMLSTSSSLLIWQDFVYMFETELLRPPSLKDNQNNGVIVASLSLQTAICQRSLCCNFDINVTTTYAPDTGNRTNRGDDYNSYYYRLAVFDGVRTYSGYATGGIQFCSIIACADDSLESCGLRADDVSASPMVVKDEINGDMIQTSTVFDNILISTTLTENDSLIGPDILVTGEGDSFGALILDNAFSYQTLPPYNCSAFSELKSTVPIKNLITFGIYARQYDRDGQPQTARDSSFAKHFKCNTNLEIGALFAILLINFHWS